MTWGKVVTLGMLVGSLNQLVCSDQNILLQKQAQSFEEKNDYSQNFRDELFKLMQQRDILQDQAVEQEEALLSAENENLRLKKELENLQQNYYRDVVVFFNQKFIGDDSPVNTQAKWLNLLNNRITTYEELQKKLAQYQSLNKDSFKDLESVTTELNQQNKLLKKKLLKHNFFLNKGFSPQKVQLLQQKLWSKELLLKKVSVVNEKLLLELKKLDENFSLVKKDREKLKQNFFRRFQQLNQQLSAVLQAVEKKLEEQKLFLRVTQNQNQELSEENDFLKHQNQLKNQKLEHLELMLALTSDGIASLELEPTFKKQDELSLQLCTSQQELERVMQKLSSLEQALETSQQEKDVLLQQLENCKDQMFQKTSTLKNKLIEANLELQKAEHQIFTLQDHCSEQETEINQRTANQAWQQNIIEKLKQKLESADKKIQSLSLGSQVLKDTVDSRFNQKNKANYQVLQKLSSENMQLAEQIVQLQKKLKNQESKLVEDARIFRQKIKMAEQEIRDKKSEQKEIEQEFGLARQELDILKKSLHQLHKDSWEAVKFKQDFESKVNVLQSEISILKQAHDQNIAKIQKKKGKIARLKQALNENLYSLEEVRKQKLSAEEKNQELKKQKNALLAEVDLNLKTIKLIQDDHRLLQQLSSSKTELLSMLKGELDHKEQTVASLQKMTTDYLKNAGIIDQSCNLNQHLANGWILNELKNIDLESLQQGKAQVSENLVAAVTKPNFVSLCQQFMPLENSITKLLENPKFVQNATWAEQAELNHKKTVELEQLFNVYKLLALKKQLSSQSKLENSKPLQEIWASLTKVASEHFQDKSLQNLKIAEIGQDNLLTSKLAKTNLIV